MAGLVNGTGVHGRKRPFYQADRVLYTLDSCQRLPDLRVRLVKEVAILANLIFDFCLV